MEGLPCKAKAQAKATTAHATAFLLGRWSDGSRMRGGLGGSASVSVWAQSVSGPRRNEGRPGGVVTSPSKRRGLREGVTGGLL